jgi:hypothetical protein
MKRSELKEAIKAEITSVLSEEMTDKEREDKLQQAKRGGGKEKPLRKLAAIGKKEDSLKEEAGFTEVSKNEIKFHLDQFYGGNIDGNALANAIEEIVFDRVSFSDVREDEEPTSAELKKKDSVATISNKLQKLTAKMKKKAKEFKEAEGKAKDKIKDELKDMTAEKKKLEKSL